MEEVEEVVEVLGLEAGPMVHPVSETANHISHTMVEEVVAEVEAAEEVRQGEMADLITIGSTRS